MLVVEQAVNSVVPLRDWIAHKAVPWLVTLLFPQPGGEEPGRQSAVPLASRSSGRKDRVALRWKEESWEKRGMLGTNSHEMRAKMGKHLA